MYHNKFLKQKTDNNWEAYRKQRNLVTKLKKKTKTLMGFVITGCANLVILGEIPSYPVAFLMFNLFICLVTKSSFIGLKNNLSLFVLFVSILTNQSFLKN
jgi:hypothetical protein